MLGSALAWFSSGDPKFVVHISSSWVEISLHIEFQLPRLPESRTVSFSLNPIMGGGGSSDPNFSVHISSSWVSHAHEKNNFKKGPPIIL